MHFAPVAIAFGLAIAAMHFRTFPGAGADLFENYFGFFI